MLVRALRLPGAAAGAACFDGCVFDHAQLDGVQFNGGMFRSCVFRGRLVEVSFSRRPWGQKVAEDNEMYDVDFSDAELVYTEFRDLAIDQVTWPTSDAQVLFARPRCVLKHLLSEMEADGSVDAGGVAGLVEVTLARLHRRRQIGLLHEQELGPLAGRVRDRVRELEQLCSARRTRWWQRRREPLRTRAPRRPRGPRAADAFRRLR